MHPTKQDQDEAGRLLLAGFKLYNNTINAKHYHQMFQWLHAKKNKSKFTDGIITA
jgi:hypothetical protein